MFDEYLHSHFLWLVSIGRAPHTDFWCNYPALGYVITLPFFRLLPESVYSILALRFLASSFLAGLAAVLYCQARRLRVRWVWGLLPLALVALSAAVSLPPDRIVVTEFRTDSYAALLAILALSLMFKEPTFLRGAFAAGLSVLSVAIMPKYVYPLFLANLAYLGYGCLKLKRAKRSVLSAVTGTSAALLLTQVLLATAGTSLWEDVYWSPIIMMKYISYLHEIKLAHAPNLDFAVGEYFAQFLWIGLLLLLGLVGWFIAEKKTRGIRLWTGGAIIAGVILWWGTSKLPYRQYLVPGLFCLVLFTPYLGVLLKNKAINAAGALLLVALLLHLNVKYTRETAVELASGRFSDEFTFHSFDDLAARQKLLNLIPRGELVVGIDYMHPIFRENLTFLTYDLSYLPVIPINSRVWDLFQARHLEVSLKNVLPASIALPSGAYPPGWNKVLAEFLERHSDRYQAIEYLYRFEGEKIYIRKDLLTGVVSKN